MDVVAEIERATGISCGSGPYRIARLATLEWIDELSFPYQLLKDVVYQLGDEGPGNVFSATTMEHALVEKYPSLTQIDRHAFTDNISKEIKDYIPEIVIKAIWHGGNGAYVPSHHLVVHLRMMNPHFQLQRLPVPPRPPQQAFSMYGEIFASDASVVTSTTQATNGTARSIEQMMTGMGIRGNFGANQQPGLG